MWPGPFEQILDPLSPRCCIWNSSKISPVVSKEKSFENVECKHSILMTLGRGNWMILPFDIHIGAYTNYFHITKYHCFGKMQFLPFSLFNIPRDQIWSSQKMDQDQPRVTSWRTLVVLSHLMLHTMFQSNQPSGSVEENLLRFLPCMGIVAILSMRPGPFEQNFNLLWPGYCIWNLIEIDPAVSEEKSFKNS